MVKKKKRKKRKKGHCLQGANPVLPQGEGPLRGNSRNFFLGAFWDVMGNPMKGIDNDNDKTTKTTCFPDRFIPFGGVILYLGFLVLHLEIWSKKRKGKKEKKDIAYRGLILFYHRGKGPLGGTLAIFF